MNIRTQFLVSLMLLALIIMVAERVPFDIWLQNHFYDAAALNKPLLARWVIDKHNPAFEFWLHKLPKMAALITGAAALVTGIMGAFIKRLGPYRARLLFFASALGLVALLVGGAKQFTNVYCPNQTVPYGGDKPYVKLLEPYPADFHALKKGRCFPAGHATAGFGFMALYFFFTNRKARLAGLVFGITWGWTLGVFQMLRGEHFLSHTLFAMVASWLVILLTLAMFRPFLAGKNYRASD